MTLSRLPLVRFQHGRACSKPVSVVNNEFTVIRPVFFFFGDIVNIIKAEKFVRNSLIKLFVIENVNALKLYYRKVDKLTFGKTMEYVKE